MNTRLAIIGDGISTELFLYYFPYEKVGSVEIYVYEKSSEWGNHRIDDVPFYFNAVLPNLEDLFVPIEIEMGIYDQMRIYTSGSKELSLKYSMKTIGVNSGNTIRFLEKRKKAYVINDCDNIGRKMLLFETLHAREKNIHYVYECTISQIDVINKVLTDSNGNEHKYDILISSIPLNAFIKSANLTKLVTEDLISYPFFIRRYKVLADNKYRVLYCTDSNIRFTRIAKLNDTIFVESRNKLGAEELNADEMRFLNEFNLLDIYSDAIIYQIIPGRFKQIQDDTYSHIIENLRTNSIFLLGRMATWRFKLVEDIVEDCKRIYESL